MRVRGGAPTTSNNHTDGGLAGWLTRAHASILAACVTINFVISAVLISGQSGRTSVTALVTQTLLIAPRVASWCYISFLSFNEDLPYSLFSKNPMLPNGAAGRAASEPRTHPEPAPPNGASDRCALPLQGGLLHTQPGRGRPRVSSPCSSLGGAWTSAALVGRVLGHDPRRRQGGEGASPKMPRGCVPKKLPPRRCWPAARGGQHAPSVSQAV